jgi:hypothetical protein
MIFHRLFGIHIPDPDRNRWEGARFLSDCATCGRTMERQSGKTWQLAKSEARS